MKISSWNVNSVRARITNIINYLKTSKPDILLIQEIKTQETNFPYAEFKNLGYTAHVFGQKSYNGVAFLSRINIDKIDIKFLKDKNKQSRVIVGDVKNKKEIITLINIYVPNGNPIGTEKYEYKKYWYNLFTNKIKKTLEKNKNIIIGGDFNVIPEEIDVFDYKKYENDALFKLEIRKKFRELINLGFQDIYRYFYKDVQEYTFWDYMSGSWQKNNGMRIDHFLVSNNLLKSIKNINIDKKPRSKIKPSDHTPIELELS
jgi:exodeoxyribonuclease III